MKNFNQYIKIFEEQNIEPELSELSKKIILIGKSIKLSNNVLKAKSENTSSNTETNKNTETETKSIQAPTPHKAPPQPQPQGKGNK
jgi:hypothetical protein